MAIVENLNVIATLSEAEGTLVWSFRIFSDSMRVNCVSELDD